MARANHHLMDLFACVQLELKDIDVCLILIPSQKMYPKHKHVREKLSKYYFKSWVFVCLAPLVIIGLIVAGLLVIIMSSAATIYYIKRKRSQENIPLMSNPIYETTSFTSHSTVNDKFL